MLGRGTICKEAELVVSNNSISDKIDHLIVNDMSRTSEAQERRDRLIVVNEGSITRVIMGLCSESTILTEYCVERGTG